MNKRIKSLFVTSISLIMTLVMVGCSLNNNKEDDGKDEFKIGLQALDYIEEKFEIRLTDDEAGFIALYIVTALFGLSALVIFFNESLGIMMIIILLVAFEIFIEATGMVNDKFHPIISIFKKIFGKKG